MTALCGTPAGYSRHIRYGQAIDDPCRWAHALTHEIYRMNADEDRRARERDRVALRSRALTILGQRHPAEVLAIVEELKIVDKSLRLA